MVCDVKFGAKILPAYSKLLTQKLNNNFSPEKVQTCM